MDELQSISVTSLLVIALCIAIVIYCVVLVSKLKPRNGREEKVEYTEESEESDYWK